MRLPYIYKCCTLKEYMVWKGAVGDTQHITANSFCFDGRPEWCMSKREEGKCIRSDGRFKQILAMQVRDLDDLEPDRVSA